jgi:thiosulfate/3-mercaptopyruvate sulfurtransferase
MSAGELVRLLTGADGPPPVLFDVRWRLGGPPALGDYQAGHIPGAVFVDLDRDLSAPAAPTRGRHPLPDPLRLQESLRRLGLDHGDPVAVYDERGGTSAARAWWVLRWAGVGQVRLLDGGVAAWIEAGASLTAEVPTPEPGDITVAPGSFPVVDAEGAARIARTGVLLDARAGERYRGDQESVDPVAGHIPGALSAPTTENLAPDGRFLEPAALRRRFAALGATGAGEVAAYCGSGVTACHQILALRLAGIEASLYPGSWSEWIADPSRAVATGPAAG